jgi:hypothetical protein
MRSFNFLALPIIITQSKGIKKTCDGKNKRTKIFTLAPSGKLKTTIENVHIFYPSKYNREFHDKKEDCSTTV